MKWTQVIAQIDGEKIPVENMNKVTKICTEHIDDESSISFRDLLELQKLTNQFFIKEQHSMQVQPCM